MKQALCPFCRTAVFRKGGTKTEKEKGIIPLLFKYRSKSGKSGAEDRGKQRDVETVD